MKTRTAVLGHTHHCEECGEEIEEACGAHPKASVVSLIQELERPTCASDHAALKGLTEAGFRLATMPLPHRPGEDVHQDDGEGGTLLLRNCPHCHSTVTMLVAAATTEGV